MYTVLTTSNVPDDYSLPHISKYHDQRFVPYLYVLSVYSYRDGAAVQNGILQSVPAAPSTC
jgi:hypothetical protein